MLQPGKLIEIHCSEQDRFGERPLYEAILERCRALRIAGATVLHGLEGYGETAAIHRKPVTVLVADSAERIEALLAEVERMVDKGMIAVSDVSMRRVTSQPAE
jgi:hypothetical protein